jgi:hypothetical protein
VPCYVGFWAVFCALSVDRRSQGLWQLHVSSVRCSSICDCASVLVAGS